MANYSEAAVLQCAVDKFREFLEIFQENFHFKSLSFSKMQSDCPELGYKGKYLLVEK